MRPTSVLVQLTVLLCLLPTSAYADSQGGNPNFLAHYNPVTGNVRFELAFSQVGIDFKSASGSLVGAEANDLGAIFDDSLAPHTLSWLNFGTFLGSYDAGNVVTPGTEVQDLSFVLISGLGGLPPGSVAGCVVLVPEPSTCSLLFVLFVTAAGVSRRRRNKHFQ